jgi:hypothetical protein
MSVAPVTQKNMSDSGMQSYISKRTGTEHAVDRLECHVAEGVDACGGAGVDHGELATDLVARERVVWRELCGVGDDVEVRHRRLDHDNICALGRVALLQAVSMRANKETGD